MPAAVPGRTGTVTRARVPLVTLAVVAVLLGAGGCGSDAVEQAEASSDPVADLVEPTTEAGPELLPLEEIPRDSRQVSGPSFTLSVPAEFQQSEAAGPGGVTMLVLGRPATTDGGVVQVAAFEELEAESGPAEQMSVLGASLRDLQGVTDFERDAVAWPGATDAVIAQWTQGTSTRAGDLQERYAQLVLQLDEGHLATVIAVAPEAEFESSRVLEVLRSVVVTDPAA